MKAVSALCVLFFASLGLARPGEEHYTNRFDDVDLEQILSNRKLFIAYIKCILDQGKCTADAKELKGHMGEALETHCEKCTQAQKEGTRRVIGHLINNEKDYWNELTAKYDPDKKYAIKYEKELAEVKA